MMIHLCVCRAKLDRVSVIQWNLSNPDIIGADSSVLNSEVCLIQGLHKCGIWDG